MKTKPIVYYLSSLPGVGKTKLAVQKMKKHLLGSKGLIIYSSPTKNLLKEVRTYLERDLPKSVAKKIRMVVSDSSSSTVSNTLVALLNNTLGSNVTPLKEGSVILMTHSGFLRLPDNLPRKEDIFVIFDEAHKFTAQLQTIGIKNEKELELFKDLISKNSYAVPSLVEANTRFRKFSLSKWPAELKNITESSNSRGQYAPLREVIEGALNKRTDVYVSDSKRGGKHNFFEVTMPSRVFAGFNTVLLMAAFLEDTQMWHLLKPQVELRPLWLHPEFTKIKTTLDTRTSQILDRFARLCIFPLTNQEQPMSMRRLENGIMVPAQSVDDIRLQFQELKITSTGRLLSFIENMNIYEPATNELVAIRLLKKVKAKISPFKWYLDRAIEFVDQLRAESKVLGDVLAVVNDKYAKTFSDNYPDLVRIPTVSHGLNKYLSSNALIFMAALHPKPEVSRLYKALLPEYSYMKDHVADACAQAVTRLSVRDVDSEMISYAIVPDQGTAKLLHEKLLARPTISSRAIKGFGMVALQEITPEHKVRIKKTKAEKKSIANARAEKWRSDEINRKLSSKRANRSIERAKLKNDPSNKKALARIDELETEIQELLALKNSNG